MGNSNLYFILISLLFILFSTSFAQFPQLPFIDVCSVVPCVEGECVLNASATLGFDCICNPGWKPLPTGLFNFTPCVLPNCTINSFNCDNAPPPPQPPPQLNNCAFVWCNYGRCLSNGSAPSDYECQCVEGAVNVLNIKTLPCFQACTFGGDCHDLMLGSPSPPPPNSGSPPSSKSGGGTNHDPNCAWNLHVLPVLLLAAIILTWF